jgi:hypothetical protein
MLFDHVRMVASATLHANNGATASAQLILRITSEAHEAMFVVWLQGLELPCDSWNSARIFITLPDPQSVNMPFEVYPKATDDPHREQDRRRS